MTSVYEHQENAEICSSISSWVIEECGGDRSTQRSKSVPSSLQSSSQVMALLDRNWPGPTITVHHKPAGAVLGPGNRKAHRTNNTGLFKAVAADTEQ